MQFFALLWQETFSGVRVLNVFAGFAVSLLALWGYVTHGGSANRAVEATPGVTTD